MYLNYINNFRGLAILFVISIHVLAIFSSYLAPSTYAFIRNLIGNGTVLFVFIAGLLFQHLSGKYNFRRYITSKIKYVLLPYLLISIPAIIYVTQFSAPRLEYIADYPMVIQVLLYLITGSHLLPLWFMPMIVIYYLISPLLIKLDRTKYFYHFLPLFIVLSILADKNVDNILVSFIHYLSVYIFGMYFSNNKQELLQFIGKRIVLFWAVFIVLVILGTVNEITGFQYSPLGTNLFLIYLNKMVLTCILMYVLYKHDEVLGKKFNLLASYSFGIYFIHEFFDIVLDKVYRGFNLELFSDLTIIAFAMITFMVVLLLCLGTIYVIKKVMGKKSRYIIGS